MPIEPPAGEKFRFPTPRPSRPLAYALSVLLPAAALLCSAATRSWSERIPFILFFLTVSIVSAAGGLGPGLVAAGASTAFGYALLRTSATPDHAAIAHLGALAFAPVALFSAWLGAIFRAAIRERERAIAALRESESRERAHAAELQAALCGRDEFLAAAAHELKTPLTALQLQVQQLARAARAGLSPSEERVAASAAIARTVARMTRLVNDLLELSRIAAGKLPLQIEDVDLAELAREVAARFALELERSGSRLSISAEAPVVGRWDRQRLDQILTNLLSNAIRYGRGAPIEVRLERGTDLASLTITDRGIGIGPDELERIFERFERGDRTRMFGGLGIGLWIVREAVHALKGAVRVESIPDSGSVFTVELPIDPRRPLEVGMGRVAPGVALDAIRP
jgi:signal transduction histidine kinase